MIQYQKSITNWGRDVIESWYFLVAVCETSHNDTKNCILLQPRNTNL
jgi:hypothetical protein